MESAEQPYKFKLSGGPFYDRRYSYYVSSEDVESEPYWNPASDPPPLSIIEAIKYAQNGLQQYCHPDEEWKLRRITLVQIEDFRWIYQMSFSTEAQFEARIKPSQFFILVKMDGTILEPIFEN